MSCSTKKYDGEMSLAEAVDLKRFMGTWFVVGVMPTFIEKNCVGGIEHYDLRDDSRVDITFSCFKNSVGGEKTVYNAKAWVIAENEWRVQFLWPFKADFLILEVDPEYQWTVIGHPSKKYVWIMHRERQMSDEVFAQRKKNLEKQGYDLSKLEIVPQPQIDESVETFSLSELQWKNRVVYIAGSDRAKVREQHRIFSKDKQAKKDRKLLVLLPEELSLKDRAGLSVQNSEFEVLLIGLDGGVKLRSQNQIELGEVFNVIDQMPMRRNEKK